MCTFLWRGSTAEGGGLGTVWRTRRRGSSSSSTACLPATPTTGPGQRRQGGEEEAVAAMCARTGPVFRAWSHVDIIIPR